MSVFATTYFNNNISQALYFECYQPIGTKSTNGCQAGNVVVMTVTGDYIKYKYDDASPPKIRNDSNSMSGFKNGDRIKASAQINERQQMIVTNIELLPWWRIF